MDKEFLETELYCMYHNDYPLEEFRDFSNLDIVEDTKAYNVTELSYCLNEDREEVEEFGYI